ncbi:uncharacterized protein LOC132066129 [Lycium ferocissimum]|uniref:uncharacterized protein LOC132066129 n=1 Tax=Lycium ferocissimum TaxID=112874 RepID=UPI0028159598|nr:uncharacterized protein LOC132066129 [Lycium ferocissimum]
MGDQTKQVAAPGAETAEVVNASHPYFISSSDAPGTLLVNSPFDGKGFAGWRRGMLIALNAKNKASFINGTSAEPTVGSDLHKAWSRANNMVISWILNSLSREISESVIYYTTAENIWKDLEARFGQSSGAQLFQLQKELNDLVQGSNDIATYYTKMKRLWDELDSLDTAILCTCVCTCEAKGKAMKAKQDERLVKFLMGLNDGYCGARGNILMIFPLPTIANAYALLMQEEKQREMHSTPKYPGETSSFLVTGQNSQKSFYQGESSQTMTGGQGGQRPFYNEAKAHKGFHNNKKTNLICRSFARKLGIP